jgi:hypothetical protein
MKASVWLLGPGSIFGGNIYNKRINNNIIYYKINKDDGIIDNT